MRIVIEYNRRVSLFLSHCQGRSRIVEAQQRTARWGRATRVFTDARAARRFYDEQVKLGRHPTVLAGAVALAVTR